MKTKLTLLTLSLVIIIQAGLTQTIPFEVFAGDKKTTLDLLVLKNLKGKEQSKSRFLFFDRNRIVIDNQNANTTSTPQFSTSAALSCSIPALKGFAPMALFQATNKGIFPKAGISFLKTAPNLLFFGWATIDFQKDHSYDYLVIARFTPPLAGKIKLYSQVELLNTLGTAETASNSLTQRFRLGLKLNEIQFGVAMDLNEVGRASYTLTTNTGAFVRYEF